MKNVYEIVRLPIAKVFYVNAKSNLPCRLRFLTKTNKSQFQNFHEYLFIIKYIYFLILVRLG